MPELVLAFPDALAVVLDHARRLPTPSLTEARPLTEALRRVTAAPIAADRDQPPFDRSTRDGFALRSADVSHPRQVIGQIRAGEHRSGPALAAGQAIEIMTGAPIPAGADAVVMIEHTTVSGTTLTLDPARTPQPGQNIVPRAAEARAGDALVPAGRTVSPAEIALAASCGASTLQVFQQPRVAILATGDELVEITETPAPHQIRNSNTYALAALVAQTGGQALRLPIARDTRDSLLDRIAQAATTDLLLLSGGVSMGKYDLVEDVLQTLGAEFFFTGALIQPGRPIVFGKLANGAYFFGLPGNPVSTQVCFHLFVAPLLRAHCGCTEALGPHFVEARLAADIKGGAAVTRFLPAELISAWDHATVRLTGWQGSGDLAANARANCYAVLPTGQAHFAAGETVRVLLR